MNKLHNVTRFEVIDPNGRALTRYDVEVDYALQDEGRTLKVFLTPREPVRKITDAVQESAAFKSNEQSAQPCGCDPGCKPKPHFCATHDVDHEACRHFKPGYGYCWRPSGHAGSHSNDAGMWVSSPLCP